MRRDVLAESHEGDGNTLLDPDEAEGLIPSHLATRADLNQWEARNIAIALRWLSRRTLDVLEPGALEELHRRMFDRTWAWAGTFRRSEKNISPYSWHEVPRLVRDLLENTAAQRAAIGSDPEGLDQLAARFHHGLVRIHPWPNGNGRAGRLATDLLLLRWGREPFSWGAEGPPARAAGVRERYIAAMRSADAGAFAALFEFVRS